MVSVDTFMMFTVFSGLALCGVYFRSQYLDWRRRQTADVRQKLVVRLLYQVEAGLSRSQECSVDQGVDIAGGSLAGSPGYGGAQLRSVDSRVLGSYW
jgi:hypothetical protein